MAHLRILQIVNGKSKNDQQLKLLPGMFASDKECEESIKKNGDYLFLEVHTITKSNDDGSEEE